MQSKCACSKPHRSRMNHVCGRLHCGGKAHQLNTKRALTSSFMHCAPSRTAILVYSPESLWENLRPIFGFFQRKTSGRFADFSEFFRNFSRNFFRWKSLACLCIRYMTMAPCCPQCSKKQKSTKHRCLGCFPCRKRWRGGLFKYIAEETMETEKQAEETMETEQQAEEAMETEQQDCVAECANTQKSNKVSRLCATDN
jgi:hypothetical protein